jgi:hypothetical protein
MMGEERAAHRRSESLIQHMADIGVHPVAISRRIQERLPTAWEVLGSGRMADDVSVKTAYNTKWGYHISKFGGGWVVNFIPDDLDMRRASGSGQVGGYLTSRGLAYDPEVYPTRKAAYDILAQHAMKGRYLQYKNPKSARSGAKAHILGGVAKGRGTVRSMLDRYDESEGMRRYLASQRSNPRDWALAYEGRLRDMTRESDGLIHVEYNPKGRRAKVAKRAKYVSAQAAGLARGQSLMSQAADAFHAGKYPNMAAALKGVSKKSRR